MGAKQSVKLRALKYISSRPTDARLRRDCYLLEGDATCLVRGLPGPDVRMTDERDGNDASDEQPEAGAEAVTWYAPGLFMRGGDTPPRDRG